MEHPLFPAFDVLGRRIGKRSNFYVQAEHRVSGNCSNVPLGDELRAMPIFIGNDAHCATLGEHTYGSGKGVKNFVLLTLGTGVGGGIVADGTLLIGNSAAAGEFGHHQILRLRQDRLF